MEQAPVPTHRADGSVEMIERQSLCLPNFKTGLVMHQGDEGYLAAMSRYFEGPQNDAGERLMALKARLRDAATADFWRALLEGMTNITGAQYSFVVKRVLVDDQKSAVEMPPSVSRGRVCSAKPTTTTTDTASRISCAISPSRPTAPRAATCGTTRSC